MANANIDFLIKVRPHLLAEYAAHHKITYSTELTEAGDQVADELIQVVQQYPEDIQSAFFVDICDIDAVGTGNGCEYLVRRVQSLGKKIDEKLYEELENAKERALYFYLHWYDVFSEIHEQYAVDNLRGWRGVKTHCKSILEIRENIPSLEDSLKELYKQDYKGNNLKVKWFEKGDRAVFIAYIEDSLTSDTSFNQGNLNTKTPRRPVFSVFFSYRSQSGVLEVKADGGKQRIQELQKIFIAKMLKEEPILKDAIRYDFEKIQDLERLTFPTEIRDEVLSVTLRGLRIVDHAMQVTFNIDIGNMIGAGTEPMVSTLKEKNIDLKYYRVTQFKLEIIFDNHGKGPQRKVTTAISSPNICDLKERPIDNVVRGLLKRWEIDLF